MADWNLRVELREIPISLLSENTGQIPDVPKNPRKITKEKFDALCESIRTSPEMKVLDEVKVYPYNGRFVVIKKHYPADCMLRRQGCSEEQTADEQIKAFSERIHQNLKI